jgi:hypothetical protein
MTEHSKEFKRRVDLARRVAMPLHVREAIEIHELIEERIKAENSFTWPFASRWSKIIAVEIFLSSALAVELWFNIMMGASK